MKAYSEDLRTRIVHCFASGQDVTEVAQRFKVSVRTMERYLSEEPGLTWLSTASCFMSMRA